ncbi:N-acetylglutamate synthase-like GNAT family acetyltransferase [Duganella sp. 1224]|uniref:GNAT family N-acetyltransferase n=1 Tax=Duganella sp. 1224 TaxID=2587052 RepID=UPI0015CA1575|nr:GNAT family N-acetyltransferase [Duganella sp. 1224]NYE60177.1 N-acetylglutamate synthase-like GNAT family acetyltransferase [Duganella sp. 1224]
MKITHATPSDHAAIAAFYAEAGYGAALDPADMVIIAEENGQLIGAVRLCAEHGVTVLRGMQIRRDHQRQGIGTRLLAACLPHLNQREAYCLPYAHLASFYGTAGFAMVDSAALPDFLAARLASYLAKGQEVIAMRRPSPATFCLDARLAT